MNEKEFKERTKKIALRVIKVVEALPSGKAADIMGRQLVRCGTSVGANYRAACRGKSSADVAAKLGIVEEEADETLYWLELLADSGKMRKSRLQALMDETEEILAMTVASIKTLRSRNPKSKI
jgi:four helix bundle protein